MKTIKIPISIGELFDKISILIIKKQHVKDKNKLNHITKELNELNKMYEKFKNDKYLNELLEINQKIWEIEDKIRVKENNKEFDEEYISLARGVYINNDKRFEIKNKINKTFDSNIKEVKLYKGYDI